MSRFTTRRIAWLILAFLATHNLSRADIVFEDVTESLGIVAETNALWGAVWFDSDQDGRLDLHLNCHFQPPILYANQGADGFADVSYRFPEKVAPQDRHSFLFGDFVRNGYPDLYIVHGGGGKNYPDGSQWNELLTYDPLIDRYVDITDGTGLKDAYGRGRGSVLVDYTGDGVTDFYISNEYATGTEPPYETPCTSFLGDMAGHFTHDPNNGLNLEIRTWGAPLACDYDHDGDVDFMLRAGGSGEDTLNVLLQNNGGEFTNVAAAAGLTLTRNNMGAAWGDYDNDGWMDLAITHQNSVPGATVKLFRNNHDGTFSYVSDSGFDHTGVYGELAWADFDNDGYQDLYVGSFYNEGESARNLLYRNLGNGTFAETAVAAGATGLLGGWDPVLAVGDYDADGLVDILTAPGFFRDFSLPDERVYLYHNTTATTNTYLELDLRGEVGNELAVGARVEVTAGSLLQSRQHFAGVAHHSQNSPLLHFGTGSATHADITVYWPNGRVSQYPNVETNQLLVLDMPTRDQGLTDGPLVGAVTHNSARVFVRTITAGTVEVQYSTDPQLADAQMSDPVTTEVASDYTAILDLANLPADTPIHYNVLVDGVPELTAPYPSFRTFTDGPTDFTVALIADLRNAKYNDPVPAYVSIAAEDPACVIQLGDFDHRNPFRLAYMRQMHRQVRGVQTVPGTDFHEYLGLHYPYFHVWDDHDYAYNNADKTFVNRADALQAFGEYHPTPPLPNPDAGVWHSFTCGQAEFFMLDVRAQRDPSDDPDGPEKSMLDGDEIANGQKDWLFQGLLNSTATWKFLVTGVSFNANCKPADSWGAFLTERQELLDFIASNNIQNVIVLSGDAHTGGAIDDGSHAGLPEISVPHTNLITQTASAGPCPEEIWSNGFTSGVDGAGYGLVRVEAQPPRAFLETYGEDGTLRLSLMLELPQYTLTLNTAGQGTITADPNLPAYAENTTVELTANADPGWTFDHWEDDLAGSTNPDTLLMDGPKAATAVFTQEQYALTVSVTGQGSVTLDPNSATYTYGETVTLTAEPEPGWTFDHWEGGLSGSTNPESLLMDGPKSIAAVFVQDQYELTLSVTGQGTVSLDPNSATFTYGETVTLTAEPGTGWSFDRWEGDLTGSINPESLLMDGPKGVTAVFVQDEYTLTINITGQGTVAADPNDATYTYGQTVELAATAEPGYTFDHWEYDLTGATNPETLLMDGPKTVTAVFVQDQYALTVNITGQGTVALDPNATTYTYGETVMLTAEPAVGWAFDHWEDDLTSATNPETLLMDAPKTVAAVFVQDQYGLTVNVVGQGTVILDPNAATYSYGQTVQVTADAAAGWTFDHWEGGLTGSTNPETLLMDGPKTVTAVFVQDAYALTVNITGQGTVALDPNTATYTYGESVTLTAEPALGWTFDHWEDDLTGATNPETLLMDGPKTVTAVFVQDEYALTVNMVGQGSVALDPNYAAYTFGETVTLTAEPAPNWIFDHWEDDLTGSTNPETLIMDGPKTVTAVFVEELFTLTIDVVGLGSVELDPPGGEYPLDQIVDLTAVAEPGYQFSRWEGDLTGLNNPDTVTIDGPLAVTAVFIVEQSCPADLNGDNTVDLTDLQILLANYGLTAGVQYEDGDLDGDGDVDLTDIQTLLSYYGTNC